jgi:hypothetical protein
MKEQVVPIEFMEWLLTSTKLMNEERALVESVRDGLVNGTDLEVATIERVFAIADKEVYPATAARIRALGHDSSKLRSQSQARVLLYLLKPKMAAWDGEVVMKDDPRKETVIDRANHLLEYGKLTNKEREFVIRMRDRLCDASDEDIHRIAQIEIRERGFEWGLVVSTASCLREEGGQA